MAISVTLDIAGDKQLARSISRFSEGVKDLRPAFHQIANFFYQTEKKQFDSEGGHGSGGWEALSPTYAIWKDRNFPGKPILQRSGRMMMSLIGETGDSVKEMERLDLRIGTRVPYAIFHQEGTRKMPDRKVIELTESDKQEWVKIVQRWLVNMAKQAGLR